MDQIVDAANGLGGPKPLWRWARSVSRGHSADRKPTTLVLRANSMSRMTSYDVYSRGVTTGRCDPQMAQHLHLLSPISRKGQERCIAKTAVTNANRPASEGKSFPVRLFAQARPEAFFSQRLGMTVIPLRRFLQDAHNPHPELTGGRYCRTETADETQCPHYPHRPAPCGGPAFLRGRSSGRIAGRSRFRGSHPSRTGGVFPALEPQDCPIRRCGVDWPA